MNRPRVGDDTVRLLGGYRLGAGAGNCIAKADAPQRRPKNDLVGNEVGGRLIGEHDRDVDQLGRLDDAVLA
jgi:hypothetical protein